MPLPLANAKLVADGVEVLRQAIQAFLTAQGGSANYVDVLMLGHNIHKLLLLHVLEGKPPLTPEQAAVILKTAEQTWARTVAGLLLRQLGPAAPATLPDETPEIAPTEPGE